MNNLVTILTDLTHIHLNYSHLFYGEILTSIDQLVVGLHQ